MYRSCDCLDEARATFDALEHRNVFSWNILLAGYAERGQMQNAEIIFRAYPARDSVSSNAMIAACGHCGRLDAASVYFQDMEWRSTASWNSMIAAFTQNGHSLEARRLFERMPEWNSVSVATLISACGHEHIEEAWAIFTQVTCRNIFAWNSMLAAYAQKGQLDMARLVFARMPQRDDYSWNAIISANSQHGHLYETLEKKPHQAAHVLRSIASVKRSQLDEAKALFDEMPHRNVFPWTSMLAGYAHSGEMLQANRFYARMPHWDVVAMNAMVAANAINGHLQQAREMFHSAPMRNAATWNSMISGCSQAANLQELKGFLERMPQRDSVSWVTAISAFSQDGDLQGVLSVFNQMPHCPVMAWNAVIAAFAQNGEGEKALQLFRSMDLDGVHPDAITFVSVLDACAAIPALPEGKMVHEMIQESSRVSCLQDPAVVTTLLNMYGKCGDLGLALRTFRSIAHRSVVSWSAVVTTFANNGRAEDAVELFLEMLLDGVQPVDITFVTILSACSHAGMFDFGCQCFISITADFGMVPSAEDFRCMIDLLERSGHASFGDELMRTMPFEPDHISWRTMLAARKLYGDVDRAWVAAQEIFRLDPECCSPYVLLADAFH